jgi:signal transduction histidine kinase
VSDLSAGRAAAALDALSADVARQMLDAMGLPAWLHCPGLPVRTNAALRRLCGLHGDTPVPADQQQLLVPEDRAALDGATDECLWRSGEPPAQSVRLLGADGSQRPVELSLRRLQLGIAAASGPAMLVTCQDLSDIQHVQTMLQGMSSLLRQIVDGAPVASFVIDRHHRVTHWNAACTRLTGHGADEMIGSTEAWRAFYPEARPLLADLIVDGVGAADLARLHGRSARASGLVAGAYEAQAFFPQLQPGGCWLNFTAAPLRDHDQQVIGAIVTLQDVTQAHRTEEELTRRLEQMVEVRSAEMRAAQEELHQRFDELQQTNQKLAQAQNQLLQSDKMASIGQLAAGVAHEINNPVGFVSSNLHTLRQYVASLLQLADAYGRCSQPADDGAARELRAVLKAVELDYLKDDLPQLLDESADGLARVKKIVQDLKDFSRVDQSDWQQADLNAGLESTLNVVLHEVKYKAQIVRRLQPLPLVLCLAGQLNQVFMNLIVNASQAISGSGTITLSSGAVHDWAWVQVDDTGSGMSDEVMRRIFEPFYTTKQVGQGTGLGLSLSFSIVQRHGGVIQVRSQPGAGSRFRVWVPVAGPQPGASAPARPPAWD